MDKWEGLLTDYDESEGHESKLVQATYNDTLTIVMIVDFGRESDYPEAVHNNIELPGAGCVASPRRLATAGTRRRTSSRRRTTATATVASVA